MLTFITFFVMALAFTVVSLKWYNLLFSFVGSISWIGLWAYTSNNPPTGVVIGSFVHQILMYSFIIMALVTMLLYFRNRGQAKDNFNSSTDKEGLPFENSRPQSRGIMDLNSEEYKAYLRAKRATRR